MEEKSKNNLFNLAVNNSIQSFNVRHRFLTRGPWKGPRGSTDRKCKVLYNKQTPLFFESGSFDILRVRKYHFINLITGQRNRKGLEPQM